MTFPRVRVPALRPVRASSVTASVLALLALGASPSFVSAQVLYGSIVGNVTDGTGAAVPGATITVTHRDTGA